MYKHQNKIIISSFYFRYLIFNTFVRTNYLYDMKKFLTITALSVFVFSMQSCFLFKPVQKQCPAYSLDQDDAEKLFHDDELANQ